MDAESGTTIDWQLLTREQQEEIIEKLSEQTGTTKEAILKGSLKVGLPIRCGYTISCGISRRSLSTEEDSTHG